MRSSRPRRRRSWRFRPPAAQLSHPERDTRFSPEIASFDSRAFFERFSGPGNRDLASGVARCLFTHRISVFPLVDIPDSPPVRKMKKDLSTLKDQIVEAGNLPRHIAIIMDGNGRWARQRGLPRIAGHREGISSVREVVRAAGELGIEALTLYVFSAENWRRSRREIGALMRLLRETTEREIDELMRNNVRLAVIGRLEEVAPAARRVLEEAMARTSHNGGLLLNLAINYGGRDELIDAIRCLTQDVQAGKVASQAIDEKLFSKYLYTGGLPDPDLLIRTSGEMRVSNFLLWQIAYTEIYVTDVLWPDFRSEQLYRAIQDYQGRERRFGGI